MRTFLHRLLGLVNLHALTPANMRSPVAPHENEPPLGAAPVLAASLDGATMPPPPAPSSSEAEASVDEGLITCVRPCKRPPHLVLTLNKKGRVSVCYFHEHKRRWCRITNIIDCWVLVRLIEAPRRILLWADLQSGVKTWDDLRQVAWRLKQQLRSFGLGTIIERWEDGEPVRRGPKPADHTPLRQVVLVPRLRVGRDVVQVERDRDAHAAIAAQYGLKPAPVGVNVAPTGRRSYRTP